MEGSYTEHADWVLSEALLRLYLEITDAEVDVEECGVSPAMTAAGVGARSPNAGALRNEVAGQQSPN